MLHSHALNAPWYNVTTFSPSIIPLQTSKYFSSLFIASTGILFLPPGCFKNYRQGLLKGFLRSLILDSCQATFPGPETVFPFPESEF